MGKINVLEASLANMIAAGEVIERPASVVKELVENSIDAKASEVLISIKDGGREEIIVRDNGEGMDKEDLEKAFTRHATSKINNQRDLFNIETLGFRGEALPSISAVAKVSVQSCVEGKSGWKVEVEDAKIKNIVPSDSRRGTEVKVQNLFYNTPARLKHLKHDNVEAGAIYEIITNIAFGYPNIKISLYNNEKQTFYSSGNGNIQEIVSNVYGLDTAKLLIPVNFSDNDFEVSGFIGTFTNHRASRKYMNFTLNNRFVRIAAIQSVLIEAYQNYLPINRYPVAILNIQADPRLIDVNVHPSKREVRLSKDDRLYNLIKENVRTTLLGTTMIPKVDVSIKNKIEIDKLDLDSTDLDNVFRKDTEIEEQKQEQFVLEEPKEAFRIEEKTTAKRMRPIGQIHGTYIVAESEDGFYLIDQHAAMERINFEKYTELLNRSIETTAMLIPLVIELSLREVQIIKDKIELLKEVGIELEIFGNNAVRVISIPLWMNKEDVKEYVNGAIEQILANKNVDLAALRTHVIATIACKASLKANHSLTITEQQELLDRLMLCNNPHCCPHGRPVMIFYSIYEIEKLFKRVM